MSVKIQDSPSRAAFDVKSAQDLRSQFQKDPQQGLKAAAQQFETLFLQQVIKSMRDATPQDGLLNSDQSRFYTGLLDQQMAQNIAGSGKGIGFARLIEQQLGRNLVGADAQAGLNCPGKCCRQCLAADRCRCPASAIHAGAKRFANIGGVCQRCLFDQLRRGFRQYRGADFIEGVRQSHLAAGGRSLAVDRYSTPISGRSCRIGERLGA